MEIDDVRYWYQMDCSGEKNQPENFIVVAMHLLKNSRVWNIHLCSDMIFSLIKFKMRKSPLDTSV